MYKEYAMVVQNIDTKEVEMSVFMGRTENEARWAFRAAYTKGRWQILSVVEIPE